MEIESRYPKEKYYRLQFLNGEYKYLRKDLLQYFKTLNDMVLDYGDQLPISEDGYTIIPIAIEGLTPLMMSAMIWFYFFYNLVAMISTDTKVRLKFTGRFLISNEETAESTPRNEWIYFLDDEYELAELIKMADYLQAGELVLFGIDYLYKDLEKRDTPYLEKRFNAILKRKPEVSIITESGRPLTRLYRRAKLIKSILESLLVQELVRGIDQRIRKYASIVVDTEKMSFIRYGQDYASIFIHRNYTAEDLGEKESLVALTEGERLLETQKINDIVAGETFFGVLTEKGEISFFGEMVLGKEEVFGESQEHPFPVFSFPEIKEPQRPASIFSFPPKRATIINAVSINRNPVGVQQDYLAIWSGPSIFVVLSSGSLFFSTIGYQRAFSLQNVTYTSSALKADDILDVSCGDRHALILTKKGLYGWGDNNAYQLTDSEQSDYFADPVLIRVLDENDEIEKIYCRGTYSLILTRSNSLYIRGKVGVFSIYKRRLILPAWKEITLPETLKQSRIQLISGYKARFVVVADNRIWLGIPNYNDDIDIAQLVSTGIDEEIRELIDHDGDYLLVVTSSAIYLIGDAKYVAEYGGSSSTESPFKLNFSLEQGTLVLPNKKPRLACLKCFAEPQFFSKKKESLFCSRYCFYK